MRKTIKVLFLCVGIVFLCYFSLRIIWSFREKKVLNIYILDKTVSRYDRHEHKSFTWILNNCRYVMPNRKSYSYTEDYYGFFPVDIENEVFDFKSVRINEVDGFAAAYDVAYFTDCYGVNSFEWYKGKSKPIKNQKIYGGLNQNDFLLLKKMFDNGKLIITEYNMFSSPTNALIRSKTEEIMSIGWTGWSGKYFPTFDVYDKNGPPEWMKNLFESQHMGVWPLDKGGIILLNNDGLLELLIQDQHLNSSIPKISTSPEHAERFGVKQDVEFIQWFEFISPGENLTPSHFQIDVNPEGKKVLERLGLNPVTPAVIERAGAQKFFYFCGDFAENPSSMWTAKIAGAKAVNHFINQISKPTQAKFFKNYYNPMLSTILKEHYNYLQEKK